MARTGRNEPCPCGSGRKAKRCCAIPRGPSQEQLAQAQVAQAARRAVAAIPPLDRVELLELVEELPVLPTRDLELVLPLPALVSPELARLFEAIRADDPDAGEEDLDALVGALDTPQARARLADAVAHLERAGRLDRALCALALIDLGRTASVLVRASLFQAAALACGAARTPRGLIIAA